MSISKRNVDVEAALEPYYQNDSSKPHEISRRDINKISCELSSDSEEKEKGRNEKEKRKNRIGLARKKIKFRLPRSAKWSHAETAQRERRQELRKEIRKILIVGCIAESYKKIENRLNQIFVVAQKLTNKEVEVYKILKEVFFDERITDYITIESNRKIIGIVKSCDKRIIHVNNPFINTGDGNKFVELSTKEESKKAERDNDLEAIQSMKDEIADIENQIEFRETTS
ncbi:23381_t:CDS:2 [Cetraspora pellucida]|uniref:23381_t:CDS:1 n=1 Tax=Cetraspora pellucida TaxID=1433469 RepID=A0A9N8WQ52_9GLOM|nr:23381_t:CDS:2 [Cetraspora pellucida]